MSQGVVPVALGTVVGSWVAVGERRVRKRRRRAEPGWLLGRRSAKRFVVSVSPGLPNRRASGSMPVQPLEDLWVASRRERRGLGIRQQDGVPAMPLPASTVVNSAKAPSAR